jgi:hypothetical protein
VPRDRDGAFEPNIVGRHQRRFEGFDGKILSMYERLIDLLQLGGDAHARLAGSGTSDGDFADFRERVL